MKKEQPPFALRTLSELCATQPPQEEDFEIPGVYKYSAFYDLVADAAFHHRLASEAKDSYVISRHARASILASALSVECAANCILASVDVSKTLSEHLDKLSPILKIETALEILSIKGFDRGRIEIQCITELINARNDHVHSKATKIPASMAMIQDAGHEWRLPFSLEGELWKGLGIPKRAMFWNSDSSLLVLKALSGFLKYLFADLMKLKPTDVFRLLPSQIEVGEMRILGVFDEVLIEVKEAGNGEADFSFLKLKEV